MGEQCLSRAKTVGSGEGLLGRFVLHFEINLIGYSCRAVNP